ncbi:MAG: xanthine dehydrogenase accessory protein XdhC [Elusimicrobia bacterium]|nr:xanthine dehydrogenase accessory protein XdhC [Elusimicrobiota bacterium]
MLVAYVPFTADLPRPAVFCTIVKTTGSAPQEVGAKMLVTPDKFYGTIGGGALEHKVLKHAREIIGSSGSRQSHTEEYALTKESGQCCGGKVEIFFEVVPRRKIVHLLGGGHVARATAHILSQMPFDVIVVDERQEWASKTGLPQDIRTHCQKPLDYARKNSWSRLDAVCILTHSHRIDFHLAKFFLKQPVGYLGMIGSKTKLAHFLYCSKMGPGLKNSKQWERLWKEKMHFPIGIPIKSKNPKIIAVSIAAELLQEWAL